MSNFHIKVVPVEQQNAAPIITTPYVDVHHSNGPASNSNIVNFTFNQPLVKSNNVNHVIPK